MRSFEVILEIGIDERISLGDRGGESAAYGDFPDRGDVFWKLPGESALSVGGAIAMGAAPLGPVLAGRLEAGNKG